MHSRNWVEEANALWQNQANEWKTIADSWKEEMYPSDRFFDEEDLSPLPNKEIYTQFGYLVADEDGKDIVKNALTMAFGSKANGFIYDEDNKIRLAPYFFDNIDFTPQQLYLFRTFKQILESETSYAFRTKEVLNGGNTKLPDAISYKKFIKNEQNKKYVIIIEMGKNYNKGALYDTYRDQKEKYQSDNNIQGDYTENIALFQSITFWHELGHIVAWILGLTWFNKTKTSKQNELFEQNNKFSIGYENIFRTHMNLLLRTGRTHQTRLAGIDVKIDDIHLLQKPYK